MAWEGSRAMVRPFEFGLRSYWGAKVERSDDRVVSVACGRKWRRWSGKVEVRTCWTFLEPASWVRTVGHLIAADRSRWRRADHDLGGCVLGWSVQGAEIDGCDFKAGLRG